MNAHDVPDLAYGDAPDAFDSADGRTYSGPVTAVTPGQATLSPAFARWYRIGLPLAADDVLAAAWAYQHEAERTFWAQVDAAQDARPAPGDREVDLALAALAADRNQLREALRRIATGKAGDPSDTARKALEASRDYREQWESVVEARPAPGDGIVIDIAPAPGALLNGVPLDEWPDPENPVTGRTPGAAAPGLADEGTPPDVRPRADGRRGLDITCGKCGEDYGTNVPDLDQIECPECGARRCPQCRAWHGGDKW